MKNIKNEKIVEIEESNIDSEKNNEEVTEMVIKPKWSLKKKLMLGGGVLAGLVLGAMALGSRKSTSDGVSVDIDEDDEADNAVQPDEVTVEG